MDKIEDPKQVPYFKEGHLYKREDINKGVDKGIITLAGFDTVNNTENYSQTLEGKIMIYCLEESGGSLKCYKSGLASIQ